MSCVCMELAFALVLSRFCFQLSAGMNVILFSVSCLKNAILLFSLPYMATSCVMLVGQQMKDVRCAVMFRSVTGIQNMQYACLCVYVFTNSAELLCGTSRVLHVLKYNTYRCECLCMFVDSGRPRALRKFLNLLCNGWTQPQLNIACRCSSVLNKKLCYRRRTARRDSRILANWCITV